MTSLRTIVVSSVLLVACNPDAPPQTKAAAPEAAPAARPPGSLPQKRLPPNDPHAEPPPGEDPPMPDLGPSAAGTLDAMIEGKPAHFVRLPPGQNRAIALPGDGVGRVRIEGSEDEKTGLPHLRVIIEGVRPDQLQYPITIGPKGKVEKGPHVSIRYEVNEHRVYVIDPAKDAEAEVTLEGWEGSTIRGRFAGKLAPTAAGLGAPIPITGKFAVQLGLAGVEPGPTAAPSGDAPKLDAPPAK